MTLGDIVTPAAAAPEKSQPNPLALVLGGKVPAKRLAHQPGYRDSPAARQRLELAFHAFVNEKCRALHMTYYNIPSIRLRCFPSS